MSSPASNASRSTGIWVASVFPTSMLLALSLSPEFALLCPAVFSVIALRSKEKHQALAGAIGLALCVAMLIAATGYRIGSDMAHRDNAMSCPAKAEISSP